MNSFDLSQYVLPILFTFFILVILVLIVIGLNYSKKIKNKPKKRFKYLDTFYFRTITGRNDNYIYSYYVVCDNETSKIYAIDKVSFKNANLEIVMKKAKLLKGQGIRSNFKEVNFNDEGNLWINEELSNFYSHIDNNIQIGNFKLKYDGNIDNDYELHTLYHLNSKYDISLLDKATFITGVAEFDD